VSQCPAVSRLPRQAAYGETADEPPSRTPERGPRWRDAIRLGERRPNASESPGRLVLLDQSFRHRVAIQPGEGVREPAGLCQDCAVSRPSASELRDALRAGLVERLSPDGWRQVGDDGHWLVALVCPVADEFVATVEVWQASSYPDRPPVMVTYMHAGVGYEPLRRLAPLLGMFGLDAKSALIWPETFAEDEDQDDEYDEGEGYDEEEDEEDEDEERSDGRELRTLADADLLAASSRR
jgi:hypothetical protein